LDKHGNLWQLRIRKNWNGKACSNSVLYIAIADGGNGLRCRAKNKIRGDNDSGQLPGGHKLDQKPLALCNLGKEMV